MDVKRNPVNNIDPLGSFNTKFGAWLYKIFHGGTIEREAVTEQYFVGKQVKYIGHGLGVAFQRRFDWNGLNTPYIGSGWGHSARSIIANILNVNVQASSLYELGLNSILESSSVQLTGDLLEKVKQDPAIARMEGIIVTSVYGDNRYSKEAFTFNYKQSVQLGGKRGSLNPFSPKSAEIWKVAANPLTWSVRSVNIRANVRVSVEGAMRITYSFIDNFDLRPERRGRIYFGGRSAPYDRLGEQYDPMIYGGGNRPWEYNATTSILGLGYHDIIGGSDQLKVTATWISER